MLTFRPVRSARSSAGVNPGTEYPCQQVEEGVDTVGS